MSFYDPNVNPEAPTNYKPATIFDRKHGTTLSQQYVFPFGLSADETYEIYSWCRLREYLPQIPPNQTEAYCDKWNSIINNLRYVHFPYEGVEGLNKSVKEDILCGMASEYNFDDIVYFSIKGIKGFMNDEVKDEIDKTFSSQVKQDIGWVISPATLEKMKEQIKDGKLSLSNIAKEIE